MTRKTLALTALLLAALLALTACADDTTGGGSGGSGGGASSEFNDADVAFAQQMIPHHKQAIEMAKLAEDRASSDEVKELAAGIEAAQDPEIEQMTAWLESWGEEVPSGGMEGMEHGDMSGMMNEGDMKMLEDSSGAEFDRMFLEMMVEHHEGAIEMAETEVAEGENPDAVELAEKIASDQEAEIEKMNELLGS